MENGKSPDEMTSDPPDETMQKRPFLDNENHFRQNDAITPRQTDVKPRRDIRGAVIVYGRRSGLKRRADAREGK